MRSLFAWIANHELVATILVSPLLMFPNRYTPVGLVVIAVLWPVRLIGRGVVTVRTTMDLPIIVLAIMTFISLYPSVSLYLSWPKLLGIFLGMAVFYAIVNTTKTERSVWYVAGIICAGGVAVALISLVGTDWSDSKIFYLPQANEYLPRLAHLMPKSALPTARDGFNPNEVGGALAILLPVPVALLLSGHKLVFRVALALSSVIMAATLVLSQSRSAFLGVAVALVVLIAWRYRRMLILAPLVAIGLSVWVYAIGPGHVRDLVLSIESTSGLGTSLQPEDRIELWWTALQMIKDFPLTGIGLNTFPLVMENLYPVFAGFYRMPHAHNIFLQTAVDLGIPGLLAFVGLLVALGQSLFRGYRLSKGKDEVRALIVGLGCGVIAYLAYGLTDAVTLGAKPGIFFWLTLGLVASVAAIPWPQYHHADGTIDKTLPDGASTASLLGVAAETSVSGGTH